MVNFDSLTAEIGLGVWDTPANFIGFRVLAALLHQPNFAVSNRGRHLYLAGRPSRWALAHILAVTETQLYLLQFTVKTQQKTWHSNRYDHTGLTNYKWLTINSGAKKHQQLAAGPRDDGRSSCHGTVGTVVNPVSMSHCVIQ